MAFPSVKSSATSTEASPTTTHSVTLPASIASGDLIWVQANSGSIETITGPAGFTEKFNQDSDGSLSVFAKVADGTESSTTISWTTGTTTISATIAKIIEDWAGALSGLEIESPGDTTSSHILTFPTITASWGSDDNLFIIFSALGRDARTVSTWPTGYVDNRTVIDSGGGTSGTVGIFASRDLASDTDSPSDLLLNSGSGNAIETVAVVRPVISGPSITTIAPDPATTGAELTFTGTTFEAVQGTGGATQEQGAVVVALTENSWSDTEVTADSAVIEDTQLKYGTQTGRITNDSAQEGTKTFVANPATGNAFVDLTSVATAGDRITAIPDLAANDQIRYANELSGGGGFSVVVNADATFSVDGATPDGTFTFEVRAWDDSDQTWGTAANQTVIIGEVPSTRIGLTGPLTGSLTSSLTSNLTG